MQLKTLLLTVVCATFFFYPAHTQNSAGNSFFMDFELWNTSPVKPPLYIDCGNSNLFNTSQELTMEVWIRAYNTTWNQKIMGKLTNTFDNGYVMAVEVGKNYSEAWNPNNNIVKDGNMPIDSAWIHLATTYAAGADMIAYVNGNNVAQIPVASSPISSSANNFIIGIAPWDLISLQTFGYIDEIRIWSVARSQTEIRQSMHKQLTGNEPGLVAYYDFNISSGNMLPDRTANLLDGTVYTASLPFVSWQPSFAAVGDVDMYDMTDVTAIWYGKDSSTYNYATTTTGLNLIGDIKPKAFDYAVYGHNDSSGISNTFIPANAPSDFNRLSRQWYFNKGGSVTADLYFNLQTAAAGGIQLPLAQLPQFYTLLVRDNTTQTYTAVACANTVIGGTVVKFQDVPIQNGKLYTLGVGSTQIANPSVINEMEAFESMIAIYPNPAGNSVQLNYVKDCEISIYNMMGQHLKNVFSKHDLLKLNISEFINGIYFIHIKKENRIVTKQLVIQK